MSTYWLCWWSIVAYLLHGRDEISSWARGRLYSDLLMHFKSRSQELRKVRTLCEHHLTELPKSLFLSSSRVLSLKVSMEANSDGFLIHCVVSGMVSDFFLRHTLVNITDIIDHVVVGEMFPAHFHMVSSLALYTLHCVVSGWDSDCIMVNNECIDVLQTHIPIGTFPRELGDDVEDIHFSLLKGGIAAPTSIRRAFLHRRRGEAD